MAIIPRSLGSAALSLVFFLAPAAHAAAGGAACPAPRFAVSDLKTGHEDLDRAYVGGISLIDVDGDGNLDAMVTHGFDTTVDQSQYKPNRSVLYLGDGRGGFRLDDDGALAEVRNYASGSSWADVFHTGRPDMFMPTEAGQRDAFFRNLGGGKLRKEELGDATQTRGSNFASSWVDIDGDGDLDLLVGGPALELPGPNLVYRNDDGRFTRVSGSPLENDKTNAAAVLWADVDNDGRPDFLAANSNMLRLSVPGYAPAEIENATLFHNLGGWTFERWAGQAFDAPGLSAFNAAFADYDNDGNLDLYIGPYAAQDRLYHNAGGGRFEAAPAPQLPTHKNIPGGVAFADVNLDGNLDLLVADQNGAHLFLGDGKGGFAPTEAPGLGGLEGNASTVAAGDLDHDGRPDFLIGYWPESHDPMHVKVLLDRTPPCGAWGQISLRDAHGAVDPPGARVTLVSHAGGRVLHRLREAQAQSSWRTQNADPFLFALPRGEQVDRVEIRWPDGKVQVLDRLPAGRRTVVRRPRS